MIAAGKTPGKDIMIFSGGATKVGVDKVKAGKWSLNYAYLPYQEAYYGAVALMMALDGKPINAYIDEELMPEIVNTTGTVLISRTTSTSTSRFTDADKLSGVGCPGKRYAGREQSQAVVEQVIGNKTAQRRDMPIRKRDSNSTIAIRVRHVSSAFRACRRCAGQFRASRAAKCTASSAPTAPASRR